MKPLPQTFEQLVDELKEAFPDRCPDPSDSMQDIYMAIGAIKVIKHIESRIKITQEELENT